MILLTPSLAVALSIVAMGLIVLGYCIKKFDLHIESRRKRQE